MNTVFDELEIEQTYKELMGKMIVSKTETIWFSKGVLHLRLTSAALKQELSMNKSKIAELINEKLGKELIREVVIK
jgi:2-phosphoglycerate kinase